MVIIGQLSDLFPDVCWVVGPPLVIFLILLVGAFAPKRAHRDRPRGFEVLPPKEESDNRNDGE
jgi:hypothetical protein